MKHLHYQVENWFDCEEEMRWLYQLHWEEVALNKEAIKLNLWYESYNQLAKNGELHIVTVRDDNRIVGYHWSIIKPHLHYSQSITAFTDVYFLHPEYRKGFNGINLFKFAEKTLKECGVQRIVTASKVNRENNKKLDKSIIFKKLGFIKAETVYTKIIN